RYCESIAVTLGTLDGDSFDAAIAVVAAIRLCEPTRRLSQPSFAVHFEQLSLCRQLETCKEDPGRKRNDSFVIRMPRYGNLLEFFDRRRDLLLERRRLGERQERHCCEKAHGGTRITCGRARARPTARPP